jgi:hypothetical protein
MKTTIYNPSPIENEIANALVSLQNEIEKKLIDKTISKMTTNLTQDNPTVKFELTDNDGDHHEVVVRIVQVADKP